MTEELSPLQRRLAQRRAEKAQQTVEEAKAPIGLEDYQTDRPSEFEADELIKYVKGLSADLAMSFITEKQPKPHDFSRRDGIKFRCPHPDHEDRDPSAWISPSKGLWHCGACESGGDWVELAAAVLGYRTSRGWNDRKGDWPKFRDELALKFNWKDPEPEPYVVESAVSETNSDVSTIENRTDSGSSRSVDLHNSTVIDPDKTRVVPVSTVHCKFDWRTLFPENTFLREYMEAVTVDDSPEEFHFACALIGLGMALGRDLQLWDQPEVLANLYVCVIGQSGTGKSKAGRYLVQLLHDNLPYMPSDPMNQGCSIISSPASGEVLYRSFSKPVYDPPDSKRIAYYAPVRGLLSYPELSSLTSRAGRMGSVVKPSLIELYDGPASFSTTSLTHGVIQADQPFASMITSTQPGAIQDLMTDKDDKSGFLNRFIFLTGTNKTPSHINRARISLDAAGVALIMVRNWIRDDVLTKLGPDTGLVTWSDEADREWHNFFQNTVVPDKTNSQNDMLGRIDLLMKKLMLLLSANKMEDVLSATTVREALSLYQYFVESYGYTSKAITKSQRLKEQDDVVDALRRCMEKKAKEKGVTALEAEDWPTAREICRSMHPQPTAKELEAILQPLVRMGEVQEVIVKKPGPGRKPPRYAPVV